MRGIDVAMNHTAAAMAVVALGAAVAGAYALGKHQGATAIQAPSAAVSPFGKTARADTGALVPPPSDDHELPFQRAT